MKTKLAIKNNEKRKLILEEKNRVYGEDSNDSQQVSDESDFEMSLDSNSETDLSEFEDQDREWVPRKV